MTQKEVITLDGIHTLIMTMSEIRREKSPEETPTERERRELSDVLDPLVDELVRTEAEHPKGKPITRKAKLDTLRKSIADIATLEHPEKSFKEIHYDLVKGAVIELMENELTSRRSPTFFHQKGYLDYFEGAAQKSGEGWTAADLVRRLEEDPDINRIIQDGLAREQKTAFEYVIQSLLEAEPFADLERLQTEARAMLERMGVEIPNFEEVFERNLAQQGIVEHLTKNVTESIVNEELREYVQTALGQALPIDTLRDIGKEIDLVWPALSPKHEKQFVFVLRKKVETWLKSEADGGNTDAKDEMRSAFEAFIRSYETAASGDIGHADKIDLLRKLQRFVLENGDRFDGGELTPFIYDKDKAREYGFKEMTIEAHPEAQKIVDAIYARDPRFVKVYKVGEKDPHSNGILTKEKIVLDNNALQRAWVQSCSDLPSVPFSSEWYFQALAEHRLSNTIDGDDSNNLTNPSKPHIPGFGQEAFLLAMDFQEFDWDNAREKKGSITPQTKKILKTLFGKQDPTSITRNEVNTALWSDHDKHIQSDKAKKVIQELLGTSANPNDYELRLMRPDEYQRAAVSQGFGNKKLWTHMDGYCAPDDGHRYGLLGGDRDRGGAARVDRAHRGGRYQSSTVRLVLSRKV